ncbi:MAG: hypothetical protein E6G41_12765, partial [Actinobacteria bacterium]
MHEIDRPAGRALLSDGNATVNVGDSYFDAANVSIPVGATVTWDWTGHLRHNVYLAGGPRD